MGKRSRKRSSGASAGRTGAPRTQGAPVPATTFFGRVKQSWQVAGTRPSRTVVPKGRRPARRQRPAAPWGAFPLSELVIFAGLVCVAIGLIKGKDGGATILVVGILICAVGVLELTAREHFTGYRSHSLLLALLGTLGPHVVLSVSAGLAKSPFLAAGDLVLFTVLALIFRRFFRQGRVVSDTVRGA